MWQRRQWARKKEMVNQKGPNDAQNVIYSLWEFIIWSSRDNIFPRSHRRSAQERWFN